MKKTSVAVILHNIRSSENVGSIFRTADATGVSKIYLTGYTPSPIDRFGRVNKKVIKSALGAEGSVLYEKRTDTKKLISELKKQGFYVVAIEQDPSSVSYRKFKLKNKVAFIFGNEVSGLEREVLKLCDAIYEIPMLGKKESLNVSVSVGVALFSMLGI